MWEVADIVRLHGAAYQQQYGNTLSSVQKRAMRDIAACRTPFFVGHVLREPILPYSTAVPARRRC